eukprot:jgi/Tetstr1/422415/TSEL_013253.t1
MELEERKEDMQRKDWAGEYGAATACALRCTRPWHNSGRIVIADSWFGSVRTALALLSHGMFSVLAIKGGSAGYPKQQLLGMAPTRFDHAAMIKTFNLDQAGKQAQVTAAIWMDMKPRMVAATCGTNKKLPPHERIKVKLQGGQIVRSTYDVELSEQHGMYNQHCNAVDIHNKLSIGPGTVGDAWQSKCPLMRFFLCTLGMIETNAFLAYNHTCEEEISRRAWKCQLADLLIQRGRQDMAAAEGGRMAPMAPRPAGSKRCRTSGASAGSSRAVNDETAGLSDLPVPHSISNPNDREASPGHALGAMLVITSSALAGAQKNEQICRN